MSPLRRSRLDSTRRRTTTLTPVRRNNNSAPYPQSHNSNKITDSEISSDDDEDVPSLDESLAERLLALRDIIPPTTRTAISNTVSTTTSYVGSALSFSGKALFVISTSVLMLGVPWALAFSEEQQVAEMEKEMRARELGSEV